MLVDAPTAFNTSVLFRPARESGLIIRVSARTTYLCVPARQSGVNESLGGTNRDYSAHGTTI
jgi:hypothetical protein